MFSLEISWAKTLIPADKGEGSFVKCLNGIPRGDFIVLESDAIKSTVSSHKPTQPYSMTVKKVLYLTYQ